MDNKAVKIYAMISYFQYPRNRMINTGYNTIRTKQTFHKEFVFHFIFLSKETTNCLPTQSPMLYSVMRITGIHALFSTDGYCDCIPTKSPGYDNSTTILVSMKSI
eukprot:251144_1